MFQWTTQWTFCAQGYVLTRGCIARAIRFSSSFHFLLFSFVHSIGGWWSIIDMYLIGSRFQQPYIQEQLMTCWVGWFMVYWLASWIVDEQLQYYYLFSLSSFGTFLFNQSRLYWCKRNAVVGGCTTN